MIIQSRRRTTLVGILVLVAASTPIAAAAPAPERYIVTLKGAALAPRGGSPLEGPSQEQVIGELGLTAGVRARRTFERALRGFVADLDASQLAALAADPRVASVERDGRVGVESVQLNPPSWGLDRIDQPVGLDRAYDSAGSTGIGVHVFVVDTGIRSTHSELAGKVADGFTAHADGNGTKDCHGHGTHVAGIVAGTTFGVAKQATLRPVRVLDCNGVGWSSDVLAGIEWILAQRERKALEGVRFVVNMSLGGGFTQALEDAIAGTADRGITWVVAAGNSGLDPCERSVYRLSSLILVGATTDADAPAPYSNYGACVDVWAPGSRILSSSIRHDQDAVLKSGTSMAAPHVAGAVALLLSRNPLASPSEIERLVVEGATPDVVALAPDDSSPRLLLVGGSTELEDGQPPSDPSQPSPDPPGDALPPMIFGDGFESGSADAWQHP